MKENSLKKKALWGVIWSAIDRFSSAAVNFIIGLILARLLSPNEYGLIAMLTIFIALSQSIIDSGFSNALVHKINKTETDNSTAFYFNIFIGLVLYFIFYAIAPAIAQFYNEPSLTEIARVIGLVFLINSLCIVHQSVLTCSVDFKSQTKISLISSCTSGIIGVIIAYFGYGVWALVFQSVINAFIRMILLIYITKWIPTEKFSFISFQELFGYGSKLMFAGLIETLYRNLYTIVIGKYFKSDNLGFYSRGEQLAYFPANNITGVLQRVTFPILCKIQNDEQRLKNNYRLILRSSALIVFPVMLFFASVAEPFIKLVLTDKWLKCVEIIQILSLAFAWYPIHALNLNLLQIKGRTDIFLKIEFIKKIIGIIILVLTIPFGLITMCWGRVIYCFIELGINSHHSGKLINYPYITQFKELFPMFTIAALISLLGLSFSKIFSSNILQIFLGCGIEIALWMFIMLLLYKKDYLEIKQMLK